MRKIRQQLLLQQKLNQKVVSLIITGFASFGNQQNMIKWLVTLTKCDKFNFGPDKL